jgi:hypothetical protein
VRVQIDNFVLLSHNTLAAVLNRIRINGSRTPVFKSFTLADWVKVFDRGGRSTTVELQITRQHLSQMDADLFIADHDGHVPSSGLVKLVYIGPFGQEYIRYIDDASISSASSSTIVGLTTLHDYRIAGGRILDYEPPQ